jgi:tRNA-guanine family transglycosylase
MFDCVIHAAFQKRNVVLQQYGTINIKKQKWEDDFRNWMKWNHLCGQ